MVGPMSNSVSGPQLMQPVPYVDKDMQAMQKFARAFSSKNSGKRTLMLRLVGFCLLIKKEVIDVIGGLDENYISGNFEDDDLCLRSFIAGYKNIIAQDVFIHHYGSMTFKGNAIDYTATMQNNRQYFATKWKDIVEINETGYRVQLTKEQQLKKLLEWGEDRFSQGDVSTAIKIFGRVLLLDKTNSQALNNLGAIQWQFGETLSAMEIFQIALSFNPEDPDALANLLQAATEIGRFDLVRPGLLEKMKQAQPENPDLLKLINAKKIQGNQHDGQERPSQLTEEPG
jgi:tetratricopeptide (TPR) repeat protein